VAAHPDDHEGDHPDRDRGDHGLEALLLGLGELVVEDLEPDCDAGAERDGEADADPHPAHRVGPALLLQECADDADD
jgi:hypothetical protein